MLKRLLGLTASIFMLAACGSGGSDHTPTAGGPGPGAIIGGGSTTGSASVITLTTSASSIPSDGTGTADITAIVRDANNNLLKDIPVAFTASSGGIAGSPTTTDENGQATVTLSTAGDPSLRTITVTGSTGSLSAKVTVQVVGSGGTGATPAHIVVTSSASSIISDGSSAADIHAIVRDANNNLLPGVMVTFAASSGGVAGSPAMTDANGDAKVTLTTGGDPTLRTITVTGTIGSLSNQVGVQVVAGTSSAQVQLGSGTGTNFQPGVLAISTNNLSAGGSTSIQAVLQQADGSLYTQQASITFSSACAAQGLATITSPVSTTTGIASSTYAAKGCSGTDQITATATVGGAQLTATGSITVVAASIGSIVFESATPTNIALRGTGDSGRPETSTVVFKVLDSTGGPRAGANVQFALNTTVGGLSLQPSTAISDASGHVQTVVQAGTANTPVRVTATVLSTSPAIFTQSSQLTVTTGIADQDSFSLAVKCFNAEALNTDGVQVDVTARLADRFNNPVPDGTGVTFTTEGGNIASQCTTQTTTTESGVCTVKWTSANPRPADGRVTILATAIGEESFNDANGNGSFDTGESFADLGERFRDDNENGVYDNGEYIYDFNNNATRDPADGVFNGVLCLDTTGQCDADKRTTGIAASNVIVLSGHTPDSVSPASGATLPATSRTAGSRSYSFTFADINNNPMPSGTTIVASITGTGMGLGQPTSYTVPCTTAPTTFAFTVTASGTATSGTLTILVTTPAGIQTPLTYTVPTDP